MLRVFVVLVLLANLLFFGWTQAWFAPFLPAPQQGEREPGRLAAQVRPESVVVLPPKAATEAVSAARAAAARCLEAGPLDETAVVAAEATLATAQLPEGGWLRVALAPSPQWLVYVGKVSDSSARRALESELRKLDLAFEPLESPPELAPGLVLSRHASRDEAEAALAALAGRESIKGVRVLQLPPSPPQLWLRVPRADSEQQTRLRALPVDALAGGFRACKSRP